MNTNNNNLLLTLKLLLFVYCCDRIMMSQFVNLNNFNIRAEFCYWLMQTNILFTFYYTITVDNIYLSNVCGILKILNYNGHVSF